MSNLIALALLLLLVSCFVGAERVNETVLDQNENQGLFYAAKKDAAATMNHDKSGINLSKYYVSGSAITLTRYVETDVHNYPGFHYTGTVTFAETACLLSAWTYEEFKKWTCPNPEPLGLPKFEKYSNYTKMDEKKDYGVIGYGQQDAERALNMLKLGSKVFHMQAYRSEMIRLNVHPDPKGGEKPWLFVIHSILYETACRRSLWSFQDFYERRPCPSPEPFAVWECEVELDYSIKSVQDMNLQPWSDFNVKWSFYPQWCNQTVYQENCECPGM